MSRTAVARLQEAHPLPTKTREASDEVIGMNGKPPRDQCGVSVPWGRCTQDGFFHRLVDEGLPIWHHGDELEELVENEHLTLFAEPLPLPALTTTPRVLFVDEEFLQLTEVDLPATLGDWQCTWTTLKGATIPTQATCVPKQDAEKWLDDQARILLAKFDQEIRRIGAINPATLRNLADIGITAATDHELKFSLWIRFCTTLDSTKMRQQFDTLICGEFPECPWKTFQEQVAGLVGQIRSSPTET